MMSDLQRHGLSDKLQFVAIPDKIVFGITATKFAGQRRFRTAMNTLERMTLMLRLAIRARRAKVPAGTSRIIGLIGRAETAIAPEGTIFLRNELWHARSRVDIAPGETVRVTGINGLTLDVDPDLLKSGAIRTLKEST